MKKINNSGHLHLISDWELFMDVKDNWGKTWKFSTSNVKGGPINYFSTLAELRTWANNVAEIRRMWAGEKTVAEQIYELNLVKQLGQIP